MTALPWLGALLRACFLQTRSLWFDEASTLMIATRPFAEIAPALVRDEGNPPLYYWLMHAWLAPFADARLGLRVFSLVCGAASLFVFRDLAARLLPARARTTAVVFAVLCSGWVHAAQDGRVYAWALLLALLTTRLVVELDERPAPRLWAAYAAAGAAGLWSHYYFAFLLAAHAAWLAPKRGKGWWASHVAIAAAFAPWVPSLLAQLRLHAGDPVLGEALTFRQGLDIVGTALFDTSYLGLALPSWIRAAVGAAALAALAWSLRERTRPRLFCAVHLAVPFALVLAAELSAGRPLTQARYFTILSPFLLMGLALSTVPRVAAGLVLAAGTGVYLASGLLVDPRLDRLAALVRASSAPQTPLVHLGLYHYLPLRAYYLPERRHYLLPETAVGMDFRAMPGYSGVIEKDALARLGPCVVVDVARTVSLERVWSGDGAVLSAALSRTRRSP